MPKSLETSIYPVIHNNEDGTYSPAIMVQDVIWVDYLNRNCNEKKMANLAATQFEYVQSVIRQCLVGKRYKEVR
jgi:hypothetical protein